MKLYSVKEVAEIFGVHPHTLRRWRNQDVGPPYVRIGIKVKYRKEDLEKFVEERTRLAEIGYDNIKEGF